MTRRIRGGGPASDELAAAVILAHPDAGSPLSADGLTRRVLVPGFPYQVVYRIRLDEIVIVAVAHLKRRRGQRAPGGEDETYHLLKEVANLRGTSMVEIVR